MKKVKIAFTGPESSGKTTSAVWLAEYLACELIDEYARTYLANSSNYTLEDLNAIAAEQFRRINLDKNMIVDSEMLVMKIWCEDKYKSCSENILNLYKQQKIDIYFLCKPDIPWSNDPLRENPHDRTRLFELYEAQLKASKVCYFVLDGPIESRQRQMKHILKSK